MPRHAHLVLSTRVDPPLPLAKGWVAGLQLAALALRHRTGTPEGVAGFTADFAGSDRFVVGGGMPARTRGAGRRRRPDLRLPVRWGMGYALGSPVLLPRLTDNAIAFWAGNGGSLASVDLDNRMSVGYTQSRGSRAGTRAIAGSPC
jgi:hypothetical protein